MTVRRRPYLLERAVNGTVRTAVGGLFAAVALAAQTVEQAPDPRLLGTLTHLRRRAVCRHGWLTGPGPGACTAGCNDREVAP